MQTVITKEFSGCGFLYKQNTKDDDMNVFSTGKGGISLFKGDILCPAILTKIHLRVYDHTDKIHGYYFLSRCHKLIAPPVIALDLYKQPLMPENLFTCTGYNTPGYHCSELKSHVRQYAHGISFQSHTMNQCATYLHNAFSFMLTDIADLILQAVIDFYKLFQTKTLSTSCACGTCGDIKYSLMVSGQNIIICQLYHFMPPNSVTAGIHTDMPMVHSADPLFHIICKLLHLESQQDSLFIIEQLFKDVMIDLQNSPDDMQLLRSLGVIHMPNVNDKPVLLESFNPARSLINSISYQREELRQYSLILTKRALENVLVLMGKLKERAECFFIPDNKPLQLVFCSQHVPSETLAYYFTCELDIFPEATNISTVAQHFEQCATSQFNLPSSSNRKKTIETDILDLSLFRKPDFISYNKL